MSIYIYMYIVYIRDLEVCWRFGRRIEGLGFRGLLVSGPMLVFFSWIAGLEFRV